MKDRQLYRLPRAPLLRKSFHCLLGAVPGLVVMALPIGHWRWVGIIPTFLAIAVWCLHVLPKFFYEVLIDKDFIWVFDRPYYWVNIKAFSIEEDHGHKVLKLHVQTDGKQEEILIHDEISDFAELVQECVKRIL